MHQPTLASTLLLTVLLLVGLIFFIRASVKDRTEQVRLVSDLPEDDLLSQLQHYFGQRSYRVTRVDASVNQVIFEGIVRPSLFLAIFLTFLASIGTLCFALVLSMVLPDWSTYWLGLMLLSPLAGVFYWKGANRPEQVALTVESGSDVANSVITVKAHRDEVAEMKRLLNLKTEE
jgi:hypothetical protein